MPIATSGPRLRRRVLAVAAACCCRAAWCLKDNVALTPPMGFNTWNSLACMHYMNEGNVSMIAKKLADLGFRELGYQYFTLDDCWQSGRDEKTGELFGDREKFPSGIRAISDYIRSLGFKFGLYTDRGLNTCAGRPGSQFYEEQDAEKFASWNVDFLKNDGCGDHDCWAAPLHFGQPSVCDAKGKRAAIRKYENMYKALKKTGRSILHSLSAYQPWYAEAGPRMAHMWRVTEDVRNWGGVFRAAKTMEQLTDYHGPNRWNDPDMLIGSSPGDEQKLTQQQSRAQFSLWATMGAPLIIGANLLNFTDFDLETYSNKEVIRVNQDPLGAPGKVMLSNCGNYPRFRMGMSQDGKEYLFKIDTSQMGLEEQVYCGTHMAHDCRSCVRHDGEMDCKGHCDWDNASELCQPAFVPPEDTGEGWEFAMPGGQECQQAWVKKLQGGDAALALVNFGQVNATLTLQMGDLVPWAKHKTTFFTDLWSNAANEVTDSSFQIDLPGRGGHRIWRLSMHRPQSLENAGHRERESKRYRTNLLRKPHRFTEHQNTRHLKAQQALQA